jgi:SAM-dependent methyltransferase
MSDETTRQSGIDEANAAFWNELCGSYLARMLGITDDSAESLKKFDDWFLAFYPYLFKHVPVQQWGGKRVLEVGLGYGTLSQKIAESGADYLGIDIAAGPVGMVKHRLKLEGLPGDAVQRSFLANQLPDASFDVVTAIGCFHHTGDLQGCFDESWRLLKPGGSAHIMIYNRYSHRRWTQFRKSFLKELALESLGLLDARTAAERDRAASDRSLAGEAAPETVYTSVREAKRRLRRFSMVTVAQENMDESDDPKWDRNKVLHTWGRKMGLDLYITAVK